MTTTSGSTGSLLPLLTDSAAAEAIWPTVFHSELARRYPDRFVFRLEGGFRDLMAWLDEGGIPADRSGLVYRGEIDPDQDGPVFEPDGGRSTFEWNRATYEVLSVRAQERLRMRTHTWLVSPHREAATELLRELYRFTCSRGAGVLIFDGGEWEESSRLTTELARNHWDRVVLPDAQRERVRGTAERFFRSETVYRDLGIPWKLGFLFMGPPGTGKTLTTKALAAGCGVPFLYVRSPEGGQGGGMNCEAVRAIFQGARDRAPCILCLEDVDTLISERLRSTFLNEMDGLEEDYRGVLTVATTNHPEKLDTALLTRPSRFDFRFEFPLPDDDQRRAFLRHWLERLAVLGYVPSVEIDLSELVRRSRGMSHAYLKRVMVGVAMRMYHEEERGTAAFLRLARAELEDATVDRDAPRRTAATLGQVASLNRVGFRMDE